ncbi:MAG: hypothetical protein ABJL72_16430 [Roseobacter sp.]
MACPALKLMLGASQGESGWKNKHDHLRLVGGAGIVAAGDAWHRMDGHRIKTVMTDKKLQYAHAWQNFSVSGRTVFNAGADSWGRWRVQNSQYCSRRALQEVWTCYDMARSESKLRFIDGAGGVIEAEYYNDQ